MASNKSNTATKQNVTPIAPKLDPLAQELARLRAENEALKAKAAARNVVTAKVSAKGGISIYGLGRFPFTAYASQMEKLYSDEVKAQVMDLIKRGKAGEEFTVDIKDESGKVTGQGKVKMSFKD